MKFNPEISSAQPVPRIVLELLSPLEQISEINTKGYYSDVIIVGERLVTKVIGMKRKLDVKTIPPDQLGSKIFKFHNKLKQLVHDEVPNFCNWTIIPIRPDEPDDLLLLLVSPYQGKDIEDALDKRKIAPRNAILLILNFLKKCFSTVGTDSRSSIGIDAKPANFCLSEDCSKAIFIDFVPPRYKDENGKFWIEIPDVNNPDGFLYGLWKHYTVNGMLATLLCQISKITPENWEIYVKTMFSWLEKENYSEQIDWLNEQIRSLSDPEFIEGLANPILLRLSGCYIAYKYPDFRSRLDVFFKSYTHYGGGDLEVLLVEARRYLRNFISHAKREKKTIDMREVKQELNKEEENKESAIAFVTTNNTINLDDFRVFGNIVTTNPTYKIILSYLLNDFSIKVAHVPFDKPLNILICSPSGEGKTFIVKELSTQFKNVYYTYFKLSDCKNIDEAFEKHIGDIKSILEKNPDKVVFACLDEVDTKILEEFIFKKLIGAMTGDEFEFKKVKNFRLRNLIWVFLMSKFETPEQFFKNSSKIEKAKDFYTRIEKEYRIGIPNCLVNPEEKIIRACAILKAKYPILRQIDAMFLTYFGITRFSNTREIELLIEKTLVKLPKGSLIMRFSNVDIKEEEKTNFISDVLTRYPQTKNKIIKLD